MKLFFPFAKKLRQKPTTVAKVFPKTEVLILKKLKGIVSQDWGRLQMVLLYKSEFHTLPLDVYFLNFKGQTHEKVYKIMSWDCSFGLN
jgi:hypothetical protein